MGKEIFMAKTIDTNKQNKKAADEANKSNTNVNTKATDKKKAAAEAKKAAAEAKKAADAKKLADKKAAAEAKKAADAKKSGTSKTETNKKNTSETKPAETKPAEKKTAEKKPAAKSTASKKNNAKKSSKKLDFKFIGGLLFAKMLKGGATELRTNAEEVNKLNVFPVPDGDTGDNMTMTIESGVAAIESVESDNLAEVMKVLSRGMLLGARGNSGVILSQFFAGIAKGLSKSKKASPAVMGKALQLGVEHAYASVMTPTEGTILTVAREAVEYAVSRITDKSTIRTLFADLVGEMNRSLERTPEILKELKEANVVDSGGAGLFYIMDGINRVLNGEEVVSDPAATSVPAPAPTQVTTGSFGPDSVMTYGYCTELLVQLQNSKVDIDNFDIEPTKKFLSEIGDSIVAFKTESIVKIHVHTLTPEKVLEHLRQYGEFLTVKIENMSVQHSETIQNEENAKSEPKTEAETPKERKKYGVVMASCGDGISDLFRELGCDEIIRGGQTNNPSTNDFIEAFDKINAESIFVFPNNGNIVMAASQAADIYEKAKIYVIPAKSIGAGYVSLSSMNFDSSEPEELVKEAEEAIGRITAAYISPAVRDADMNGVHVNEGDTIGVMAKEIVVSCPERADAAHGLIDKIFEDDSKFMITVFYGVDASAEERAELEAYIAEKYPSVEAYYIDGKQEIYPYLIVAE